MRMHLRVLGAALIGLGAATACGGPTEDLGTSTSQSPGAQAPPNALTMTCADFARLDDDTQHAVVHEILISEEVVSDQVNEKSMTSLAKDECKSTPNTSVYKVVTGSPKP